MLSVARDMLEEHENDWKLDATLKGVCFSYRDIMKWGDACINENLSNQNPESSSSSKEIQELKKQLNEE